MVPPGQAGRDHCGKQNTKRHKAETTAGRYCWFCSRNSFHRIVLPKLELGKKNEALYHEARHYPKSGN
jgi:hypothetical protein